jgi:hypothetical protein
VKYTPPQTEYQKLVEERQGILNNSEKLCSRIECLLKSTEFTSIPVVQMPPPVLVEMENLHKKLLFIINVIKFIEPMPDISIKFEELKGYYNLLSVDNVRGESYFMQVLKYLYENTDLSEQMKNISLSFNNSINKEKTR